MPWLHFRSQGIVASGASAGREDQAEQLATVQPLEDPDAAGAVLSEERIGIRLVVGHDDGRQRVAATSGGVPSSISIAVTTSTLVNTSP